ncbi:phage major capsid protein [Lactiplantibacillus plantarum]|uniref:phage major capsid protein n=1 Tax=Lactiplantibacillus plantarum TaxID=1590 RepID=UPI0007607BBC|nr:phage major capsid protein [Lactiplantibacillus plantarum]KWT50884.1 capsid protein [Lactiplantibacillus plantarum]QIA85192.1 phage major capsid protein [Lactiplantibacillus plantarum]QJP84526.1 phage major capsid protein [Lactiplantibacillus plantarum]QVG77118.1 phage major capsid protein [Lactiplantibacillus plantarum]TDH44118.1 phage major capsid protein [Lactiplantibacillus plantarum]
MKIETLQEELAKNEAELKAKTIASRSLLDKEDSDIAEIKRSVDEVKELRSKSDGLREKIEALKLLSEEENRASKTDSKGDSDKEDGESTIDSTKKQTKSSKRDDDPDDSDDGGSDDGSSDDSELEEDSKTKTKNKRGSEKVKTLTKDKEMEISKRDMLSVLKNGKTTRDVTGGIGLSDGSVLIPQDILNVEHETHQFPRLGSLVRTVSVKHTTGKLPVMWDTDEKLSDHSEYGATTKNNMLKVVPINWDLQTKTGAYVYSQDLLSDSDYDWQSELAQSLITLRDNTDDDLIIKALTDGVTAVEATDLVAAIKTALNMTLKPNDSAAASIVLSQSAFNALDQLKDTQGRPLVQPDLTKGTGSTILGKTVVVIDDTLFPSAKAGDVNIIIAPLQKAVINFKNNEITGKFMDTYDVWYQQLGIYLREDVVQARKDLIVNIKGTTNTTSGSTAGTGK